MGSVERAEGEKWWRICGGSECGGQFVVSVTWTREGVRCARGRWSPGASVRLRGSHGRRMDLEWVDLALISSFGA